MEVKRESKRAGGRVAEGGRFWRATMPAGGVSGGGGTASRECGGGNAGSFAVASGDLARPDRSVLARTAPLASRVSKNGKMLPEGKYARVERERRFLVERLPGEMNPARVRRIRDYYLDGTRLRLREQDEEGGSRVVKLTQKVPAPAHGAQQGFITTVYLNDDEFKVLARLPATELSKTRYSFPPFGIDVFEGELEGLLLAEAEFDSAAEAERLSIPSFIGCEVTHDPRFAGGQLVRASRTEVWRWLEEYGIRIPG